MIDHYLTYEGLKRESTVDWTNTTLNVRTGWSR